MAIVTKRFQPPEAPLSDGIVTLRPHTDDDVPALVRELRDPEIPRFTRVPEDYGEQHAREYLGRLPAGEQLSYAIEVDGAMVGGISLVRPSWEDMRTEIGYWVARDMRGRGIATRAVRLLSRHAIDQHGFGRIEIHTDVDNPASQRVAERAGFTREAVLRGHRLIRGERKDSVVFALLAQRDSASERTTAS